jgi:predicted PurR-regulated permease PerM
VDEKDIEARTPRWALHFLALCALVLVLRYGRVMIIPVVVSMMLTSALWPIMQYFNYHWRLPRPLAGLTVLAGLLFGVMMILLWVALAIQSIWFTLPVPDSWLAEPLPPRPTKAHAHQLGLMLSDGLMPITAGYPGASSLALSAAVERSPAIPVELLEDRPGEGSRRSVYAMVHDRLREINEDLADYLFPEDPKQSFLFRNIQPIIDEQVKLLPRYAGQATEQVLFILFLVLFLLIEGEMLMRRTAEIFGPSTGPYSRAAIKALEDMATQVRAYIVWRTIINMVLTIVLGLIYQYLLGMTFPWVWAILAGILTYVPYIGPILAFVPTAADALFSPGGGVGSMLAVTLIYIVILTAEGYVVFPLVIGRNMEMNATTVLLACLFWWLVWGEIGLFLAMPLMGGIKAICQNVPGWQPWANLMGMELEGHSTSRRGRLRRIAGPVLLGPLLPVTRVLGLERWVRGEEIVASSTASPHDYGKPAASGGRVASERPDGAGF